MPRRKENGFMRMRNHHIKDVEKLDGLCKNGYWPAKQVRAAVRDSHDRAYVLMCGGAVTAYVWFTQGKNPATMRLERMGANHAEDYAELLSGIFYISDGLFGDDSCEWITTSVPFGNLKLRKALIDLGFVVGPVKGKGEHRKMTFTKLMRESTWGEGSHYPLGERVIHEILDGDCKAIDFAEA